MRVADLLGGARRGQVDCTALITSREPEAVARSVDARAMAGFAAFKLKAADGGGELDAARLGAARRAAGEGARIRLDLGGALTVERALAVLPGLARHGLEMIEQPVGTAEPAAAWSRLLSAGLPVFADESLGDPEAACAILGAGAGAALKLATVGGPRAALRLAAAATAATVGSGFESSLGLAAALHVACALAGAPLACGLATAPLLAGDLAEGLPSGPVLRLPAGPGLGVQLDHRALARYRVDR